MIKAGQLFLSNYISMQTPVIPANEFLRQQALNSYHIPYHVPEKEYDDITAIAASVCNTPIAFISFIENDRQYLKSVVGANIHEMYRNYSFCGHTINTPDQFMEVPNAVIDLRFADNPLVQQEPFIVFYAGCSLVNPDGYSLGTICVVDHNERTINNKQKDLLQKLSGMVVQLLELRKKNDAISRSDLKLAAYIQQMKDFAHIASHDLKEPLRMMHSFANLLQRDYAQKLDDRGRKFIHYTYSGARRVTTLIDELLAYAIVSYEEPPFESIDLNVLLSEILKLQEAYVEEKGALVQYTALPTIMGCRPLLKSLIQNLVINGIKYARTGTSPVIKIEFTETLTHWHFSIEDNGVGMPQKDLQLIFTPFNRLNYESHVSGTGLGLAICKNIVERHGGTIWAEF